MEKLQGLLADWQAKKQAVETMRSFAAKGGQHRMQVSFDDPGVEAVAGKLIDAKWTGALLAQMAKALEFEAEAAKKAFLQEAATEALTSEVGHG